MYVLPKYCYIADKQMEEDRLKWQFSDSLSVYTIIRVKKINSSPFAQ